MKQDNRLIHDIKTSKSKTHKIIILVSAVIPFVVLYWQFSNLIYLDSFIKIGLDYLDLFVVALIRNISSVIKVVVVFFALCMKYPVEPTNTYKFRPILFRWYTAATRKVSSNGSVDDYIYNFLRNNGHLKISYKIKLGPQYGDEFFVSLTYTRFLLPKRKKAVSDQLNGVLKTWEIESTDTDIPVFDVVKWYSITLDNHLPELSKLVRKLKHADLSLVVLETAVQFSGNFEKRIQYDELDIDKLNRTVGFIKYFKQRWGEEQDFPLFTTTLRIGLGKTDEKEQLLSIISSAALNTGISLFSGIKSEPAIGKEIVKFLQTPNLEIFEVPEVDVIEMSSDLPKIGNMVHKEVEFGSFHIAPKDLAKGGLIAGAIGTGKTNLRLHLMRLLLDDGIRIIDFDLKGDAQYYDSLVGHGRVIEPGVDFHLNPFICPPGYKIKEYAEIVVSSFVETIPDAESLSAPQMQLLEKAVKKTVRTQGTARDFFNNIMQIAHEEQQLLDNRQESSARALLVKFNWMQSTLSDIFWKRSSSLDLQELAQETLFFDFSSLTLTATYDQINFVINLLMANFMATLREREKLTKSLNTVIFVDEAQILMPKSRGTQLSKLEETVATLRYKGVSVVAAGVSADLMSSILLDVGFIAQFRSESQTLLRSLGLWRTEDRNRVHQLDDYHALIRCKSTKSKPVEVKLELFDDPKEPEEQPSKLHKLSSKLVAGIKSATSIFSSDTTEPVSIGYTGPVDEEFDLPDYDVTFDSMWESKIDAILPLELTMEKIHYMESLIAEMLEQKNIAIDIGYTHIKRVLTMIVSYLERLKHKNSHPVIVEKYPRQFLLVIIRHLMLRGIKQLQYDSKLNIVKSDYSTRITKAIRLVDKMVHRIQWKPVKQQRPTEFDKLSELLAVFEDNRQLTESRWLSVILLTTAIMEELLQSALRVDGNGVSYDGIQELLDLTAEKVEIGEERYERWSNFLAHRLSLIKNEISLDQLNQSLIYTVAKHVYVMKKRILDDVDDAEPVFEIEP